MTQCAIVVINFREERRVIRKCFVRIEFALLFCSRYLLPTSSCRSSTTGFCTSATFFFLFLESDGDIGVLTFPELQSQPNVTGTSRGARKHRHFECVSVHIHESDSPARRLGKKFHLQAFGQSFLRFSKQKYHTCRAYFVRFVSVQSKNNGAVVRGILHK